MLRKLLGLDRGPTYYRERIAATSGALDAAAASDPAWDRAALERLAREAFARERPGRDLGDPVAINAVTDGGPDHHEVMFEARDGGQLLYITLRRIAGGWRAGDFKVGPTLAPGVLRRA